MSSACAVLVPVAVQVLFAVARRARCYYGFYHGLSTVAYTFILNGLAWLIVFAVIAFRPLSDGKTLTLLCVLVIFIYSVHV